MVIDVLDFLQSIWVSVRGTQKEFDEVKLRFAAAEVPKLNSEHLINILIDGFY